MQRISVPVTSLRSSLLHLHALWTLAQLLTNVVTRLGNKLPGYSEMTDLLLSAHSFYSLIFRFPFTHLENFSYHCFPWVTEYSAGCV